MEARQRQTQAHLVVRGRVQGVYFRGGLKQQADLRRVRGWVRNRFDGSVEAVLQGPEEAVAAVVAWARRGPRGAHVESVDVEWSDIDQPMASFEVVG